MLFLPNTKNLKDLFVEKILLIYILLKTARLEFKVCKVSLSFDINSNYLYFNLYNIYYIIIAFIL